MKRTFKGWAFDKAVPSGLGNMPTIPFFRRRFMADQAAKDFIERRRIKIVRATLTICSPPPKAKGRGRK